MDYPLDDVLEAARDEGHTTLFVADIEAYVKYLTARQLPVIYSLAHLAISMGMNIDMMVRLAESNRRDYYKRFKLQKRAGGFRTIQSPDNPLRYIQRWILANILNKIPSHPACLGFDPTTSILKNATVHVNQKAILKIDLLRFFDSINEKRVYGIFKSIGFHPNLSVSLAKLCTIVHGKNFFSEFREHEVEIRDRIISDSTGILPQGGPTSPKLANLVARRLDSRLQGLCEKNGLKYSRYADDLTLSGDKDILERVRKTVYKIIRDEGFFPNLSKTRLLLRGQKFMVTGLDISNEKPRVSRKKKKEIEHHLYHCQKGVQRHIQKAKITQRNYKDWLLGSICFVHGIEPSVGKLYFSEFAKIEWPL
ncbi:RNA-directed DNA polymerase [Arcticibacter tournemirensis]|uniref:RNA-directed DNA polymerase n=1 Tax=Arcticibacter tournemirensis TaxID=699437 RepID=A0A5M9H0H0_9SPHI|nr:reverse transcriptase family protein [Arcticibacter tournemirensis]KAA8480060.1 RNA-directed DNA polymerase [Arcticibacter tournemirensis]TQM50661.1 RNA-directed DNA polymerase [Arcticibacter tournemirensis]